MHPEFWNTVQKRFEESLFAHDVEIIRAGLVGDPKFLDARVVRVCGRVGLVGWALRGASAAMVAELADEAYDYALGVIGNTKT